MFRNSYELWLLLEAAKDGGQGNGEGGEGDNGAVAFQAAMARHQNNVEAFARQLFDDNHSLRQTNRQLRGQAAPAGSTILQGDDLARWQAYQALGAPSDLVLASTVNTVKTDYAAAQTALATAQAEVATLKRGALLRDVADTAGVVYSVLATLDKPDLTYQIEDGKDASGNPAKVVKVKAGDQLVDLDTYAAQNWSAFLPALRPNQNTGTPFITQVGGGGKATKVTAATVVGDYLKQRYGEVNTTQ